MFFRIHHGIADGYSILYMFQRLFGSELEASPPFKQKRAAFSIPYILKFPLKTVRIVGELVYNSLTSFTWKIPQGKKSRIYNYKLRKSIRVENILRIKRKFNVTFSSVVFSLLSGGIHRFLKKKNCSNGEELHPMKTIPSMIPVPMSGHGVTFENHL